MNLYKTYILLLMTLIVFACEKYDVDTKNKLVVNDFFMANQPFTVEITESKSSFDANEFIVRDDLDVLVYEDGKLLGGLIYTIIPNLGLDEVNTVYEGDKKVYTNNEIVPIAGKEYTIEIFKGDKLMSKTKNKIPEPEIISKVDTFPSKTEIEGGYIVPSLAFNLEFNDDANSENHYAIGYKVIQEKGGEIIYLDNPTSGMHKASLICKEAMVDNEFLYKDDSGFYGGYLDFTDKLINGKKVSFTFEFIDYFDDYQFYNSKVKCVVYLYSLSKEFYEYIKSYNAHIKTSEDLYSEPVQMYSNIEGGLGVFAGYSFDSDTIEIINNPYPPPHD